jgi:hypothetical protein
VSQIQDGHAVGNWECLGVRLLLRPEERTVVLRKLSKKLKVTFKRDVYMALILSS